VNIPVVLSYADPWFDIIDENTSVSFVTGELFLIPLALK
jgi:hypothetical protein